MEDLSSNNLGVPQEEEKAQSTTSGGAIRDALRHPKVKYARPSPSLWRQLKKINSHFQMLEKS